MNFEIFSPEPVRAMFSGMSTKNSNQDASSRSDDQSIWPAGADPLRQSQLILDELSRPEIDKARAEELIQSFSGHEAEAALIVFARLHDTEEAAELHAVSRVLGRWAGTAVVTAIVPAMKAMLDEPGVGDLNKMTAAGLLEIFGQEVDYGRFLAGLRDLDGLAERSLGPILAAGDRLVAASRLLDRLADHEVERVLRLIDDLASSQDERAFLLLRALSQVADPDIAVSALLSLDGMDVHEAAREAERVQKHHPDEMVRRQAAISAERFHRVAASAESDRAKKSSVAKYSIETLASDSRSILVIAAGRHDQVGRSILTLHLDAEKGLAGYALSEMVEDEAWREILDQFSDGDIHLKEIKIDEAYQLFDQAIAKTMSEEALVSAAPIPWLFVLEVSSS